MIIGFTGTRNGLTDLQRKSLGRLFREYYRENIQFHHGDCVGADYEAGVAALATNYYVVIHPPILNKHRAFSKKNEERTPASYMDRNLDIVRECHILIACPKENNEQLRSGTWSTIRKGIRLGKRVLIVFPDGDVIDNEVGCN